MLGRSLARLVQCPLPAKVCGKGHFVAADLAGNGAVDTIAAEIAAKGRLDILVMSSGVYERSRDPAVFSRQIAANVLGPYALLRQLLTAVEDHDQVVRHRRLEVLEPAHQHRQLLPRAGLVIRAQQVPVVVGDRHGQATRRGPVAMDVQLAERRVAIQHFQGRVPVEMALELVGRVVLDRIAARRAREQAGAGEIGEEDRHAAVRRWGRQGKRASDRCCRDRDRQQCFTSIAIKRYYPGRPAGPLEELLRASTRRVITGGSCVFSGRRRSGCG